MRTNRAFTLIEVLLVVILSGMILTALTFHVFGLSQAYLHNEQNSAIEAHVNGATKLLKTIIAKTEPRSISGTPPKALSLKSTSDANLSNFSFQTIPELTENNEYCLAFHLNDTPQFLTSKKKLPDTTNYLYLIRNKGLVISYTSSLLSTRNDEKTYYTVLISPYITKLEYGYYDTDYNNWTFSEEPYSYLGEIITPSVIRLVFIYEGKEFIKNLSLERSACNAPLH
mgnify:CR=1 FL=1